MAASSSDRAPSSRHFSQRFSGFSLALMGIIILGVFVLAPGLRTLVEQRQQIADLEQQVADQQSTVDSLEDEEARWDDPAYIRAQTRQRLFFVVPGEQAFVVVDDVNASPGVVASDDTSTPTTEITTTEYDWRSLLAQSVYAAATSDAERAGADVDSTDNGGTTDEPTDSGSASDPG